MGWMRTLLLGDIGNRLDIQDTERNIETLRHAQRASRQSLAARNKEISTLKDELGRQKLAIEALTRFLVTRKLIDEEELSEFIAEVDAEDGAVDGKLAIDSSTKRLRLVTGKLPEGIPPKVPRRY